MTDPRQLLIPQRGPLWVHPLSQVAQDFGIAVPPMQNRAMRRKAEQKTRKKGK